MIQFWITFLIQCSNHQEKIDQDQHDGDTA